MKFPKCNLHTHTTFCDGKDSPEAIVQEAIALGMTTIGFSGHSHTAFDPDYCMSEEGTTAYLHEIHRLREAYGDRIRILCGIEQDSLSPKQTEQFDYRIGSVHYISENGIIFPVDDTLEKVKKGIDECFRGNAYAYISAYFESLVKMFDENRYDIVGHIDLVEKLNRDECLFSLSDYRYKRPLLDAVDALLKKDVIFEINTGAIARGYLRTPYPSCFALRRIAEKRGRVTLSSDAHRKENLMFWFPNAVHYAKSCGIGGLTVPDGDQWKTIPIGFAD